MLFFLSVFLFVQTASALDWKKDFGGPLLKEGQGEFAGEKMFTVGKIDDKKTLSENIKILFYPSSQEVNGQNILWKTIRTIMTGVLIFFFVWAGFKFIMDPSNESEVKKSQMNLIYLVFGTAIIFTVTWVMGTALSLDSVEGVVQDGGLTKNTGLLDRAESNIFVVILGFLKGFAFFLAIIMLVYYGYQMMNAFDKEDKIKAARTGMVNVVIALLFIKVIDFLYYIAQQKDFGDQLNSMIVVIAKFLGYIFGFLLVLVIMYIGFQFITQGEEGFKKGLTRLKNLFIIMLVLFLFLLVIYQVLKDIV